MTDQENSDPPSSGRRRKSKQVDLCVIKARVTTAERDQIEVILEARKMTMSELIRACVLGGSTKAPEELPATDVDSFNSRFDKIDVAIGRLTDSKLARQDGVTTGSGDPLTAIVDNLNARFYRIECGIKRVADQVWYIQQAVTTASTEDSRPKSKGTALGSTGSSGRQ
jgi:hypothetical protein